MDKKTEKDQAKQDLAAIEKILSHLDAWEQYTTMCAFTEYFARKANFISGDE